MLLFWCKQAQKQEYVTNIISVLGLTKAQVLLFLFRKCLRMFWIDPSSQRSPGSYA